MAASLAYLDQAGTELAEAGQLIRNATPEDFEEIGKLSFAALAHAGLAGPVLDLALANKGWIGRDSQPWERNAEPINAGRELYRAAARSNLAYVDSLHTDVVAKKRRLDKVSAQAWVRRNDPTYLAAAGALSRQFGFFELFDDDYVAAVAQMGALMGSVANASLLVAKYYSIGAEIDELGRVTGLRRQSALKRMMALAEETAELAIGEADAATNGASTPMLLVALDTARRNRDETVAAQDQLIALGYFWGTTLTARLMTKLARAD